MIPTAVSPDFTCDCSREKFLQRFLQKVLGKFLQRFSPGVPQKIYSLRTPLRILSVISSGDSSSGCPGDSFTVYSKKPSELSIMILSMSSSRVSFRDSQSEFILRFLEGLLLKALVESFLGFSSVIPHWIPSSNFSRSLLQGFFQRSNSFRNHSSMA